MKDVLKALDRNETVTILYRGKPKGIIMPCTERCETKVIDHPFFNMVPSAESADEQMKRLRAATLLAGESSKDAI